MAASLSATIAVRPLRLFSMPPAVRVCFGAGAETWSAPWAAASRRRAK